MVWLAVVAGCGGDGATSTRATAISETVAIGDLPPPLSDVEPPPAPPTTPPESSPPTTAPTGPIDGPIGELVFGNRVLFVGDEIMASTAPRFDGAMCDALNGFGWDVEIAAEPGRFVEFGRQVFDVRLSEDDDDEDFDVVAIMLGNQFDGDREAFARQFDELIVDAAPRPVIVYTLTEVDEDRTALNEFIRERPRFHRHVVVVDWAELAAADPDLLLVDGGPQLTEDGSDRLVIFTAAELDRAPEDPPGECLPSMFTDDTAIVL